MQNVILRFDLRAAPRSPDTAAARYRTALEMAAWADSHAVSLVGLSEHHSTGDGYCSSPLLLAGMMAARTNRVRIAVSALLVPLHDPIRLAEDIALLDLMSEGRFLAIAGLGYREVEYQAFGVDWRNRGQVFDEKLAVLLRALTGEEVHYRGTAARITTPCVRDPRRLIAVGGNSAAAARRAAKFRLTFSPGVDDPQLADIYHAACAESGFRHGHVVFPNAPATTLIAEEPEKAWRELGPYLLFDALAYGEWRHPSRRAYAESFATSLDDLRREGKYRILTPEEAVRALGTTGSLHLAPLTGGIPGKLGWQTLELFSAKVLPFLGPSR